MITQEELSNGQQLIATNGKFDLWGEQTGTKGYYKLQYYNDDKPAIIKYVTGIKEVRARAKRLNSL
tara:strand:- start:901 stop:1098 length:198 start_codon:yes stop_codon:yes gene_type:complete